MFAFKDLFEATYRVRDRHLFALTPGKDLRHAERLTQEPLNLARAQQLTCHRRKLIHPQNRDDVLQVFVALQYALYAAGHVIMLLPHNLGFESAGG